MEDGSVSSHDGAVLRQQTTAVDVGSETELFQDKEHATDNCYVTECKDETNCVNGTDDDIILENGIGSDIHDVPQPVEYSQMPSYQPEYSIDPNYTPEEEYPPLPEYPPEIVPDNSSTPEYPLEPVSDTDNIALAYPPALVSYNDSELQEYPPEVVPENPPTLEYLSEPLPDDTTPECSPEVVCDDVTGHSPEVVPEYPPEIVSEPPVPEYTPEVVINNVEPDYSPDIVPGYLPEVVPHNSPVPEDPPEFISDNSMPEYPLEVIPDSSVQEYSPETVSPEYPPIVVPEPVYPPEQIQNNNIVVPENTPESVPEEYPLDQVLDNPETLEDLPEPAPDYLAAMESPQEQDTSNPVEVVPGHQSVPEYPPEQTEPSPSPVPDNPPVIDCPPQTAQTMQYETDPEQTEMLVETSKVSDKNVSENTCNQIENGEPNSLPQEDTIIVAHSNQTNENEDHANEQSDEKCDEKGEMSILVEQNEPRSDKCNDRVLHCLSQVPCASLIAWIVLLLGLGGLTGSLLIGVQKTRDLLESDEILWFTEYTLTGVVVGMFLIGTTLLCVGHISTDPTSRHLFHTTKRNTCAQGLNIFMLVISYILGIAWTVVTSILGIPLFLLLVLIIIKNEVTCINLVNYGLSSKKICDSNLTDFARQGQDLMISYIVAYVSSVLITISLIHFMIVISANLAHLKDRRLATLNAYVETAEEAGNSKHSIVDTTM